MKLAFLSPAARPGSPGARVGDRLPPVARSPMEAGTRAAGARFEVRHGWNVPVGYGMGTTAPLEAEAGRQAAGWADVSHLGKLELQAPAPQLNSILGTAAGTGSPAPAADPELGRAIRAANAWWCRLTPSRALVICDPAALPARRDQLASAAAQAPRASLVDVTSTFAALTLVGPLAREVFARFSALDLRPAYTPVHALRPGSIGRQPALLICEAPDRYLFLFGWATGEYMWSIVDDAGRHLGGRPIGLDALDGLGSPDPALAGQSTGEALGA